jgi:hypothetical protein
MTEEEYTFNIFDCLVAVDIQVYGFTENHARQRLAELFKDKIQIYDPDNPRPNVIGVVKGVDFGAIERYVPTDDKGNSEGSEKHSEEESTEGSV